MRFESSDTFLFGNFILLFWKVFLLATFSCPIWPTSLAVVSCFKSSVYPLARTLFTLGLLSAAESKFRSLDLCTVFRYLDDWPNCVSVCTHRFSSGTLSPHLSHMLVILWLILCSRQAQWTAVLATARSSQRICARANWPLSLTLFPVFYFIFHFSDHRLHWLTVAQLTASCWLCHTSMAPSCSFCTVIKAEAETLHIQKMYFLNIKSEQSDHWSSWFDDDDALWSFQLANCITVLWCICNYICKLWCLFI